MREPSDSQRTETVAPETGRSWTGVPQLASGTVVGARYELRGVLGSGGSAVVYRAYDRLLKREIALKVLRPERLTANALVRLRREATAARDVVHENLIRVFDLESADGLMFLAMELVEGESLRQRLRGGPLPVEEAVRIATGLLGGLAALHAGGLLHRDVKPGNVLLGAGGEVKLADLGLVRRWERDETRATESEAVIGTFEYLSPEQAMGEELDVRSDLYSAGVVLFEMLAGRLPHEGRSSLGTLLASLRKPVPGLRRFRPEAPGWLATLVSHLLEREPGERYASAGQALADLTARRSPYSGFRKPSSRGRRRRIAAGLAAVLACAGAWAYLEAAGSRFAAVLEDGPGAVRALDGRGRTLWRRSGQRPSHNFLPLRRADGERTLVAAIERLDALPPGPERSRVDLLDPQTGQPAGKLDLIDSSGLFEGMSNRYARELAVFDLDGDGADELFVTFIHSPFWPSFTVLCEPALRRCRTILVAAGHHRPTGIADVDDDGRPEVLFAGISNRLGHYLGLAAVRVEPWLHVVGSAARFDSPASTPDNDWSQPNGRALAWYALLAPVSNGNFARPPAIDPARRSITVFPARETPRELRLDFQGFPQTESSGDSRARSRERRLAYEALRKSSRQHGAGQAEAAFASAREALSHASAAEDAVLVDWAETIAGSRAVGARDLASADASFERAFEGSSNPAATAWEAGHAFHLEGELDRAAGWYRRGLATRDDPQMGRMVHEFLESLVLALAEAGRWDEARQELGRWERSFTVLVDRSRMLKVWIDWRLGRRPAVSTLEFGEAHPDFQRYVALELRRSHGWPIEPLLAQVRAEREVASGGHALLRSLEAELLAGLGRAGEARELAREALGQARRELDTEILYRAHLPLLEERARRLGA